MTRICSHSGSHHADDAFGISILTQLFDADVIRSRDPEVWAACEFLVDVGGVYDPEAGRFDHHQKEFNEQRSNGVPYAGAGLVWRSYGVQYVQSFHPELATEDAERVAARVDANLIQHVDAVDSGITVPGPFAFSVSGIIDRFNPTWLDEAPNNDDAFDAARSLACVILYNEMNSVYAELKAEELLGRETQTLFDGQVLVLEQARIPYEPFVLRNCPDVRFVMYPSNGQWTVKVVPVSLGSFTARADLPESWAGLRDEALAQLTGVTDAVFCHKGRFIAAANTKDGAVELARQAVEALM